VSQENVEVVERILNLLEDPAGLVRNDDRWGAWVEDIAPFVHPDWVLDLTNATRIPDHLPRYQGMSGWREFIAIWSESFDDLEFEWHAFYDVGDRVVISGEQHGIAKASRVPTQQALGLVYTFRDGLITRPEIFNGSADEALKAVGMA
jgi:hypothetical protein